MEITKKLGRLPTCSGIPRDQERNNADELEPLPLLRRILTRALMSLRHDPA